MLLDFIPEGYYKGFDIHLLDSVMSEGYFDTYYFWSNTKKGFWCKYNLLKHHSWIIKKAVKNLY